MVSVRTRTRWSLLVNATNVGHMRFWQDSIDGCVNVQTKFHVRLVTKAQSILKAMPQENERMPPALLATVASTDCTGFSIWDLSSTPKWFHSPPDQGVRDNRVTGPLTSRRLIQAREKITRFRRFSHIMLYFNIGYEYYVLQNSEKKSDMKIRTGAAFNGFCHST